MNTNAKLVSLCPGDVLPLDIVVSLLIGLEDYAESYPEQSLQGILIGRKRAATKELVRCQLAANAGLETDDAQVESERLLKIQTRLLQIERQLSEARQYHDAIVAECRRGDDSELEFNQEALEVAGELLLPLASVEWWVQKKYSRSLVAPGKAVSMERPVTVAANAPENPWNVRDPNDPNPDQPWYTSARYFARQLVRQDSTLLSKRDILVNKVVDQLKAAGINKRGGKKPFSPGTVKRALVNVRLG